MPVDGGTIEDKEQDSIMQNIWFVSFSKSMNYFFRYYVLAARSEPYRFFFHRKIPKQVFFKVDDMLLSRRQFRNQSPSKNNQDQSNYFIESAYYWNKYWDSTQFKWSIPYQEHNNSVAQVSFGWSKKILEKSPFL